MFEKIARQLWAEIHEGSHGVLQCLPYTRSLLDALEILGKPAIPLVVRGVVIGKPSDPSVLESKGMPELVKEVLSAPKASGYVDVKFADQANVEAIRLHYRTIGLPHEDEPGDKTLGNYDEHGKWLGHLVAVVDGFMIDTTIGQLNDPKYNIGFDAPLIVPVSDDFLLGRKSLVFTCDDMLVFYRAYPNEKTYELSKSWSDASFRAKLRRIGEKTAAPVCWAS